MLERDAGSGQTDQGVIETLTQAPRVALFVHGEKLFAAINRLGFTDKGKALDFAKLSDWVKGGQNQLTALNYYCVAATKCRPNQEGFLRRLRRLGFNTVVIDGKGSGKERRAAVPVFKKMRRDFSRILPQYDEVVIVGGTDGFIDPIRRILDAGKKVTVISDVLNLSSDLRGTGAKIVILEEILPQLLMDIVDTSRRSRSKNQHVSPVNILLAPIVSQV